MKLKVIAYISFIQFLLAATTISGQKILYPVLNPADSRFDNFQIENGRAASAIYSLMQDSKGFIWGGAETGFYRYDGIRSVKFGFGESDTTLQGYVVISIFEDSDGSIWAGTHGALNRINAHKRTISHFIPDTSDFASPDNSVRHIHKDRKGMLWILTDRNVFRFDPALSVFTGFFVDSLTLISREEPFSDSKDKLLETVNGQIYVATNRGLFLFNEADNRWRMIFPSAYESVKEERVNCIKADHEGKIWFGTRTKGLFRITDPEKGLYQAVTHNSNSGYLPINRDVSEISPDDQGNIWFTTNNIFSKLDLSSEKITDYLISDKFSPTRKWGENLRIEKIYHGKKGDIWFLDYGSGFALKLIPETEKLSCYNVPRYVILDAIREKSGNIWFGCVANNIYRLVTDSLPYMTSSIANTGFVGVEKAPKAAEDASGNIFLTLSTGIYKITNPESGFNLNPEKMDINIPDHNPICIFRDSKENFWIGYNSGIIQKYNPLINLNQKFSLPNGPYSKNTGVIRIILEDSNGNLWFATRQEGIFMLKKGGNKINHIVNYKDITKTEEFRTIFDFRVDRDNQLWISTIDGLFKSDTGKNKILNYTGFDGTGKTYASYYYRIIEDKNRDIWILNALRSPYIYDYEKDSFRSPFSKDLSPELFFTDLQFGNNGKLWLVDNNLIKTFDTLRKTLKQYPIVMNGIASESIVLKSGAILYIIHNRLFLFPPETIINREIPPVYISNVYINDCEYSKLSDLWPQAIENIELKHNQNTLKIEFAALNYNFPELNEYRFIMTGLDRDTINSGNNAVAEYRNMPPGRYKFWVTGSNNDGIWNRDGITLDIRIHPPWYKSVIAYIIYLLIIIASVIAYIRLRIYRLTRDKERLEKEVKLRTEELEVKNLRLAEIDRIKTQFFTDISHEIRTPLTLIKGPIDILSKTNEGNEKVAGMLGSMKRNTDRLMQLVNELLDIVRLDAGKMKINLIEDDIIKNLRMLVYEFLSLAESREIKYIVEIPEAQCITWFDSYKVNIIITNLLSNAFRYTSIGGTVRCMIKIENEESDHNLKYIKITISDTGRGISTEHIEKIFERFYRVEGHHESDGHGTGIGLSMVKEFVNLMHGEIKVESTPGKGSVFTVTIPLGKDHLSVSEFIITEKSISEPYRQPAITRAELQMENIKGSKQGNLAKILLVEDNADLRNFIIENLSDSYHLLEAENGKTALGLAYSMIPDLIISDIMMPDFDGLQLCHKLKNDERTSHIPIILLTAKATTDDKLTGLKSGADDYIFKPFNMDELKTRISNLLAIREKLKQKYLDPKSLERIDDSNKSVDDRFMERVIRLINENISNFDFDVALLHNSLGMSRMHLSRKLKALTGISPHLLINRIRLEKAAELLRLKKGNVTEIANSVGISNPANFSRTFREHFGTSPKVYMNQFRN